MTIIIRKFFRLLDYAPRLDYANTQKHKKNNTITAILDSRKVPLERITSPH